MCSMKCAGAGEDAGVGEEKFCVINLLETKKENEFQQTKKG